MSLSILNRSLRRAEERPLGEPVPVTTAKTTGVGRRIRQQLWQLMARECEAMMQRALSTGQAVPPEIVARLDQALSTIDSPAAAAVPARRGVDDTSGIDAPPGGAASVEMSPLASLSVAHGALVRIIAPATPEAVLLLAEQRTTHPLLYTLGPLPIVRQMFGLAILSLFLVLGIALSAEVNVANMGKTMLELAGYQLLVKEAFLVSAASLGSCFQNLQKINVVISEGTYDPKFQSTYWTRWLMSVISGVILSQLIYTFMTHDETARASAVPALAIGQPVLALLGGYSGDLVHGILSRFVDTVGGFFRVAGDSAPDSRRARLTELDAAELDQSRGLGRPSAVSEAKS
jgi:hypothetical protein